MTSRTLIFALNEEIASLSEGGGPRERWWVYVPLSTVSFRLPILIFSAETSIIDTAFETSTCEEVSTA